MINKPIKDFSLDDVMKLVENAIPESRVLDYKSNSPWASGHDQDKIELARDIIAFANTSGGHLIYGIEEENGIPKSKPPEGIIIENIDQFITRLDQTLQARIEPRLDGLEYQEIKLENGNYIFIVQIPRSWNGPHAVKIKEAYSFYGRHASSKYPYDINDIRNAFNLHSNIITQMRNFRENQIDKIYHNETSLPLHNNAKIVLHIMPIGAFSHKQTYNLEPFYNDYANLHPILSEWSTSRKRNLEGLLIFNYHEKNYHPGYVQIYRNGIIEAVDSFILKQDWDPYFQQGEIQKFYIPSHTYEIVLTKALSKYLQALQFLKIQPPIYIGLSLVGVKNYYMGIDLRPGAYVENHPIDRDILLLPEEELDDLDKPSHEILKPSFDLIWNTCGLSQSRNYSDIGQWIHQNKF